MTENDIHLKLLANLPVEIEGLGEITFPNIKEIIRMGENTYSTYISSLLFNKSHLQNTEGLEEYSDYQLLCSFIEQNDSFRGSFFNALRLFFSKEPSKYMNLGLVYLGDLNDERLLSEESLIQLQKVIKIANFISDEQEEEYIPGNERARKFMEKLKKKKAQVQKKPKQNLHSIMSAVAWETVGISEVVNLTIYQLYDAYRRLESFNNYHYTLTGIYTGNIDGKKINLPDINWANILK